MVAGNRRVSIHADHVEKQTGTPAQTARKYASVHEVSEANGFLAPKVFEVRQNSLLLERMRDMGSLEQLYLSAEPAPIDAAIERAGEVLAILHRDLPRTPTVQWWPPASFVLAVERYLGRSIEFSGLPQATLHGDFSFANVWIGGGLPSSIVVIDPCANIGCTFDDWTFGPVYVDIGKMLSCLEGQIPFRRQHRRPSSTRVEELQSRFIAGYERFGVRVDVEVAHAFGFAVSSAQSYRRFGRLAALHRLALYNRIRGNFPSHRKQRSANWGTM